MARPFSRGRRLAAAALAAVIVGGALAVGVLVARRASEPPTTAELIRTLIEDSDPASRSDAATRLAAGRDCAIARRVAQLGAQGGGAQANGLLLRDQYAALYRSGPAQTRATAVRCLGEFDDERSAALVADALADRAPQVREAAVAALPMMERSASRLVSPLVTRGIQSEGGEARAISRALAGIGPTAVEPLVARVADGPWVAETLALIGRPAAGPLRAAVRRGRGEGQAAAAVALLRLRSVAPDVVRGAVPEIVSEMMERLGRRMQPDLAAIDVLARVGRPAVPRLVRLARASYLELSGPERNMRSSALLVLASMGEADREAVRPLLGALQRRDYAYIADLHMFYIQFGLGERELIAALERHGNTEIVLDFLTSGNRRLQAAARDYGRRKGYTITGDPASTGLCCSWNKLRLGSR